MPSNRVLDELRVTAELCGGREFSPAAAKAMVLELERYPERAVLAALARCRRECRALTLSDIVSRIDDGRPEPEEAWAMIPHDEGETVVWTPEMRQAHAVCSAQLLDGDTIGARMAFKEVYTRLLANARASQKPPKWEVSLGHDSSRREVAIREAVDRNRLTQADAQKFLPIQIQASDQKLLDGPAADPEYQARIREFLAGIRSALSLPVEQTVDPDGVQGTAMRAREAVRTLKAGEGKAP